MSNDWHNTCFVSIGTLVEILWRGRCHAIFIKERAKNQQKTWREERGRRIKNKKKNEEEKEQLQ